MFHLSDHVLGKAPLHRAVSANHLVVVKSLLTNGADINLQDSCMYSLTISTCNLLVLTKLLSVGYTACHYAAFFGLRDITECLVLSGASLGLLDRISKKTCMELAQERRHYPVVEYLSRVVSVTIPLLTVSKD